MNNFAAALVNFLVDRNKSTKTLIVALTDSILHFLSFSVFFVMPAIVMTNFNRDILYYFSQSYFINFVISLSFYHLVMFVNKGYTEIQRNFVLNDLARILFAVFGFLLLLFILNVVSSNNGANSLILLIQSIATGSISIMLILISRLCFQSLASIVDYKPNKSVYIYGTGSAARELYGSLTFSDTKVLGFITDNKDLVNRETLGKPILAWGDAKRKLKNNKAVMIYLASRSMLEEKKRKIIEDCFKIGIKVKKISPYSEMLKEEEVSLTDLTISDIVPRLDHGNFGNELKALKDKIILVTGAGGSIGSEICRTIISQKIKKLILVDISEASLFKIHMELEENESVTDISAVLADIKNRERIESIINSHKPDYIYHAAAYKHVPILQEANNYVEAFQNNFLGTVTLTKSAIACGVKNMIFVSTDKAVRPTNFMGASKRLAEIALLTLAKEQKDTNISCVRFGNVMDSSGSVLPIFRKQIKRGGPVTVTHPEVVRFFMTIREAAYLVITASLLKESSRVYMLKMGEPVKIDDIARRMIRLSGRELKDSNNQSGIEIVYTGLRKGEKLFEELLVDNSSLKTEHPKIFSDSNIRRLTLKDLDRLETYFEESLKNANLESITEILKEYADYNPSE